MAITTVIRDVNGNIINVGAWEYLIVQQEIDGVITPVTLNPLPVGAYESTADIITSDDGGLIEAPIPPTLAEVAAAKNEEINAARLAANQATFPYGGKEIACDPLSRSDIDGVAGRVALQGDFAPGFPLQWKATDNTYVAIPDVPTFKAFYDAMVAEGTANFSHAQTLKAQMQAIVDDVLLTDAEKITAIEAITW